MGIMAQIKQRRELGRTPIQELNLTDPQLLMLTASLNGLFGWNKQPEVELKPYMKLSTIKKYLILQGLRFDEVSEINMEKNMRVLMDLKLLQGTRNSLSLTERGESAVFYSSQRLDRSLVGLRRK